MNRVKDPYPSAEKRFRGRIELHAVLTCYFVTVVPTTVAEKSTYPASPAYGELHN